MGVQGLLVSLSVLLMGFTYAAEQPTVGASVDMDLLLSAPSGSILVTDTANQALNLTQILAQIVSSDIISRFEEQSMIIASLRSEVVSLQSTLSSQSAVIAQQGQTINQMAEQIQSLQTGFEKTYYGDLINPALTSVSPFVAIRGSLKWSTVNTISLQTISLPSLISVQGDLQIQNQNNPLVVLLPSLQFAGASVGLHACSRVTLISLPSLTFVGAGSSSDSLFFDSNNALTFVLLPNLTFIGGNIHICDNAASFSVPSNVVILSAGLQCRIAHGSNQCPSIFVSCAVSSSALMNPQPSALSLIRVIQGYLTWQNSDINTTLIIPTVQYVSKTLQLSNSQIGVSLLSFPVLTSAGALFLTSNPGLTYASFPSLSQVGYGLDGVYSIQVTSNPRLTLLQVPGMMSFNPERSIKICDNNAQFIIPAVIYARVTFGCLFLPGNASCSTVSTC